MTALFRDWMDTWVDATAREERGKPAGVLPSAISWPEGVCGGLGARWWRPEITERGDVYRWPSHLRLMTNTLLLTAHMTGDPKYLAPIKSMARIRMAARESDKIDPAPGSVAWCAKRLGGMMSETLSKYRFLTGDQQFDSLLLDDANAYVKFRITGDRAWIEDELQATAAAFGYDRLAYTEEVRWTDRVFGFHSRYADYYRDGESTRPDLDALYSAITGDFGGALYFPLNAVRWKTPPGDLAALVVDHDSTSLRAELFHFGDGSRDLAAEFYLLDPGHYELIVEADGTGGREAAEAFPFRVTETNRTARFRLPSRALCEVAVRRRNTP